MGHLVEVSLTISFVASSISYGLVVGRNSAGSLDMRVASF